MRPEAAAWCGRPCCQDRRGPGSEGILRDVRQVIATALSGTPVLAAWLFGSRRSGRERPDSDTDVACLLPRGIQADLALVTDLTLRLARAGVPSPEIHVLNEAPLAFQYEALRGDRVYAGDDCARAEYEAWVTLRYLDFEPLLRLQYRIQRRRLAEQGTLGRPRRRRSQAHAA